MLVRMWLNFFMRDGLVVTLANLLVQSKVKKDSSVMLMVLLIDTLRILVKLSKIKNFALRIITLKFEK